MAAPLIALDNVGKSFEQGPALRRRSNGAPESFAIRGVSLAIPTGQFVALVGASGSGKTTTLKTINRLIAPSEGEVRLDGQATTALPAPQLRRKIGYVFQGIGLFPHMTVGENIAVTPRLLGWDAAEISSRSDALLDLVALPRSMASRSPSALSGGQQQRVGLARALAARPRVMLMDEPFGALDPVTRQELGDAYLELHKGLGLTTVMVTHDVQEAVLLADRIVVMKAGQVAADGAPRDLLAGHADPDVAALMATPRVQAERVAARMAGA